MILFKEIDAYHGPQFSVMNVLGSLHKTETYWETF